MAREMAALEVEGLTFLRAAQSPSGAFATTVIYNGGRAADYNAITALVVRAFQGLPQSAELDEIRSQALDFLASCAAETPRGAYGFWPEGEAPTWIKGLPADVDDTAVIALELARAGRLSDALLAQTIYHVLLPQRVRRLGEAHPPWLRPGVFETWLQADRGRPNVVDCCVNTNVAALLAYAGLTHLPGYAAACEMIEAGLDWARDNRARLRSLTPFYPDLREWLAALAHAVGCGAEALRPSLARVATMGCGQPEDLAGEAAVCSSAYGQVVWAAPVLAQARETVQQFGVLAGGSFGDATA